MLYYSTCNVYKYTSLFLSYVEINGEFKADDNHKNKTSLFTPDIFVLTEELLEACIKDSWCSSVLQHVFFMYKALGLIPSTSKQKK